MVEPLERSVFSYMHKQFVLLNENLSVASTVKLMQQKKVETIIVTCNGRFEIIAIFYIFIFRLRI